MRKILFSFFIIIPFALKAQHVSEGINTIDIKGYIGKRINECIEKRVKAQDALYLVEPFKEKNDKYSWKTEFWGKWIQGAIASYRYKKDNTLFNKMKESVDEIIKTQDPQGYIGNYCKESQLTNWDIWGRKYVTLGLLSWYKLTGDKKALSASCRQIDYLIYQLKENGKSIINTGNFHGMASSSILEPIIYLYNYTHKKQYIDFAKYIVSQWETENGPQLISKALNGIPISSRFPTPTNWFSPENGEKAYEMMSCYIGLLEYYKITNNPAHLFAVVKSADDIAKNEINLAGSGSAFECWYNGVKWQTYPSFHTMETCVTFTWMQLCNKLLEVTGNSFYADQFEKSMYNALMAALKDDGSQIAKYSPLQGRRSEGERQCGMNINCCNANGPRAFAMIPNFAFKIRGNEVNVNFYGQCNAVCFIEDKKVIIEEKGDYPHSNNISLVVIPEKNISFNLKLRIPIWSRNTTILLNGEKMSDVICGNYFSINRKWNKGDKIDIYFDMPLKINKMNNMQAFTVGPILLARDSRFNDGFVDECAIVEKNDNKFKPEVTSSSFSWICYKIPLIIGTNLEAPDIKKEIRFCDFASAGNSWNDNVRYRVWIPETIDVKTFNK